MLLVHEAVREVDDTNAWLSLRRVRNAAVRSELLAKLYMRERWTEADVVALPATEHGYFDRKRGTILDGDRATLAKALSAFANSGGGHLS